MRIASLILKKFRTAEKMNSNCNLVTVYSSAINILINFFPCIFFSVAGDFAGGEGGGILLRGVIPGFPPLYQTLNILSILAVRPTETVVFSR